MREADFSRMRYWFLYDPPPFSTFGFPWFEPLAISKCRAGLVGSETEGGKRQCPGWTKTPHAAPAYASLPSGYPPGKLKSVSFFLFFWGGGREKIV